jgi:alkylation response protein AidB-like acyl-CoA dehydrogenase
MELEFGDVDDAVKALARTLALEVLSPAARAAERAGSVPQPVWRTLFESGLTAAVPESLGGGGVLSPLGQQIAVQNLAYGDPGIAMAAVWSGAVAGTIAEHGSDQQREMIATLISDPTARSGIALYEGFGRSPEDFETSIELEGSVVRVVGTKVAVAFAGLANPMIVVGRDPKSGYLRGALITGPTDGVKIAPLSKGLALDAAQLTTVSFDASLPATALLGGPDYDHEGFTLTIQRLRLMAGSALLGAAQRATEYAGQYATERVAFGRPIAAFQGLSFPLAESLIRIEASRLEIADLVTSQSAISAERYNQCVSDAVAYASIVAVEATRHAVQCLGGHGFVEDHPVELWYRSASALAALDFDPVYKPFEPAL